MATWRATRSARGAAEAAGRPAQEARASAATGRGWYAWLARGGLVAKGISFGIVAVLAIGVAAGRGGATTSRQGALHTLAMHTWGEVLLIMLAVGFACYAVWRLA